MKDLIRIEFNACLSARLERSTIVAVRVTTRVVCPMP